MNGAIPEDVMADKKTSDKAARAASKVLKDGRTGKDSKTSAGSALSQKEQSKKSGGTTRRSTKT